MTDDAHLTFPAASGIAAPTDHSPAGLREWIMETTRYLGLTPTEFARGAGLAASTINRFLRNLDEDGSLSAKTIDALLVAAYQAEVNSIEGQTIRPQGAVSDRPYLINLSVIGKTSVEFRKEIRPFVTRMYTIKVPIPAPLHLRSVGAFEVADDHAMPLYPKGSIVVCTPLQTRGSPPIEARDGDHLVVLESKPNPEGRLRPIDEEPPFRRKRILSEKEFEDAIIDTDSRSSLLNRATIRVVATSPAEELWLMRVNRDADQPEDCLLKGRERMQAPFLILGSYQPRLDMRKKALDDRLL